MRWLCLLLLLGGCAVKGYDLGWRSEDRLAALLGAPLDSLAPCLYRPGTGAPRAPCSNLVDAVNAELAEISAAPTAPEALGARCQDAICRYTNSYQRRDVGIAAIVPVWRKISLRTVRMQIMRTHGRWIVAELVLRDSAPPTYGPVRLGG